MKVSERYMVGIPPHRPADAHPLDALPLGHPLGLRLGLRLGLPLGLFGEES